MNPIHSASPSWAVQLEGMGKFMGITCRFYFSFSFFERGRDGVMIGLFIGICTVSEGLKVSATIAVTDTIAKRAFFGRKIISVDNQDYRCFLWLLRNRL